MTDEIKPALPAEEWAVYLGAPELVNRLIPAGQRHGVAALALYGQPFGFTQEDVRLLANLCRRELDGPESDGLDSLVNRIAALLPEPE